MNDKKEQVLWPRIVSIWNLYWSSWLSWTGIYDDRLLVKSTPGAAAYMSSATEELPYPGAKPMLLVDNVDDRAYLCGLFDAMVDALPAPRTRKK